VTTDLLAASSSEGVRAIVAATSSGERRCEDVVRESLERIAAVEDDLLAWAYLDPELALAQARALDRLPPAGRGPLHGVPVGVKDIVDTADQPTAYGSAIYAGHAPARDAAVVERLRAAGAVIVGKTVTTEFALFHPGRPATPTTSTGRRAGRRADRRRRSRPGASRSRSGPRPPGRWSARRRSAGSSARSPRSALVPTDGVKPCSHTLDTVGVLTRDVEDAGVALGAIAGDPEAFRPALPPRPLRLGFVRTAQWERLAPEVRRAIEDAVGRLSREADVVEVTLPAPFAGLVDAQRTIMGVEAARLLAPERRDHPALLSDLLRAYLDEGAALADGYDAALELTARCRGLLDDVLDGVDAAIAPAALDEAPPRDTTGDSLLCRMWTLLGTPSWRCRAARRARPAARHPGRGSPTPGRRGARRRRLDHPAPARNSPAANFAGRHRGPSADIAELPRPAVTTLARTPPRPTRRCEMSAFRIGIDTGGTFTDVVAVELATGRIVTTKTPSTPADPSEGFLTGVEKVLDLVGARGEDVVGVSHGTTVATNALLEDRIERVGLVTTEGYRHVLEIARQSVPDGYGNSYFWVKPDRIVPVDLVREVGGRLDHTGAEVRPFDEEGAAAVARWFRDRGIDTLGVCFLHAYANDDHERRMREVLAREHPDAVVSLSSEVLREYREYERTVTTLVDASVKPKVTRYIRGIAERLDAATRRGEDRGRAPARRCRSTS
jgi:Asp-tRNA(Asn)/Glu-tRNA(Gln) amidotransferase A subunit family amidase